MIEQSLGTSERNGFVNFNSLRELLIEMAKRLSNISLMQTAEMSANQTDSQTLAPDGQSKTSGRIVSEKSSNVSDRVSGRHYHSMRSRLGLSAPSIDVSTLERKINYLEQRLNSLQELPDMLEKHESNKDATPVRDMWNYTNLANKIANSEQGIEKVRANIIIPNPVYVYFSASFQTALLLDEIVGGVGNIESVLANMEEELLDLREAVKVQEQKLTSAMKEVCLAVISFSDYTPFLTFSCQSDNTIASLEEKMNELASMQLAPPTDEPNAEFIGKEQSLSRWHNMSKASLYHLIGMVNSLKQQYSKLQDSSAELKVAIQMGYQ